MPAAQQERLRAVEELPDRTEEQEAELLTLAWFTDHADSERGWHRAAQGAGQRRLVNWTMNGELGREGRADPLDDHLAELRACLPARTGLLGGDDDPRPVSALESLVLRLDLPLTRIEGAGHEPRLEQPDAVRAHLRRFVQGTRDGLGPHPSEADHPPRVDRPCRANSPTSGERPGALRASSSATASEVKSQAYNG